LKITSANRVFPTPSLPQENEPVHVPLQPNTPRHHPRLTCAPSLPCASPPSLLFSHFPFSLHKHRVNRSFRTQIRRIGARLAVPALEALGLGLPSDVVCSWHWWICSRCVGSRSGAMLIDTIPSELSGATSPGEKAEKACSGSATSENMPPAISPWP